MQTLKGLHALAGRKRQVHYKKRMVDEQGNASTAIFSCTKVVEPPFIKIYDESIPLLRKLTFTNIGLLIDLALLAEYPGGDKAGEGGVIDLNPRVRKALLQTYQITRERFQGILRQMIDAGALVRVDRGSYQLHPAICARGAWRDICSAGDTFLARAVEQNKHKQKLAAADAAQEKKQ